MKVVKISRDDWLSPWEWCKTNLGPIARTQDHVNDNYPWYTDFYNNWYFVCEEYATMFALRWA